MGSELDHETVASIASAFAALAAERGHRTILLGRDNRLSSPHIRDITVEALQEAGCTVIDLGIVITPAFYFASRYLNIRAGMMITASHNPSQYNGFKLLLGDSTIYGEEIQDIRRRVEEQRFNRTTGGSIKMADISSAYLRMIQDKVKLGARKLKVIVDCGNGTASLFAPQILQALGCEVIELYCDSDPTFPHHHPDPVNPDNMQDLISLVLQEKADLGLGIDGDGDRLGVVDNQGQLIWGDMLMILFWREILPRFPQAPCIVEVKCSQALVDEIERLGGQPILYKTGHSLIKAKMKELGAVFTGEMSGHIFFADDYYGFDDAIYAAARLLSLLSNSDQSLQQMLADVPQYYSTPEIRIASSDERKFAVVEQVTHHFRTRYKIIDVDGARILFPGGWGLVRASNTGPELIVRCEGNTPETLENIKCELFAYLQKIGLDVPSYPTAAGSKV